MLVCVPSQPCRWWPVQPVKKKDVCACMCVCRRVVRMCLRCKEQSEGIWPLYTAHGKSTDCIVYKRYAIINFSVFVVSCFDRHRESQASDWISILPHENPKRSLFFPASFCTQGRPNFDCRYRIVLSISSTAADFCSSFLFGVWKRCCVILSQLLIDRFLCGINPNQKSVQAKRN